MNKGDRPQLRRGLAQFLWLYGLLGLACLNAVLRPAADIPVTPYYVIAPFVALWLLFVSRRFRLWSVGGLLVLGYGLFVGTWYGTPLGMQAAQCLKFSQLLVLFGMLHWLREHDLDFGRRSANLLFAFLAGVVVIAGVQQQTGLEFGTVMNEESAIWLNTVFFTPNDLGLFLVTAWIALLVSNRGAALKLVLTAAIVVLNVRNDAKAALIAMALIAALLVLVWIAVRMAVRPVWIVAIGLATTVLAVGFYADVEFGFNEQEVSALTLLVDPLLRIVTLDPYDLGGSIFDRTDSLIYALTELKTNHWLGLGPGGSVYVLSLPKYELLTAKSLHNAIAELAVDFGPVFMLPSAIVVAGVIARLGLASRHLTLRDSSRAALVSALPFLAVSQSSGYVSNYAFWIAAYVVWYSVPSPIEAPRRRERPAVMPIPAREHG
jgi:hypothetical protein